MNNNVIYLYIALESAWKDFNNTGVIPDSLIDDIFDRSIYVNDDFLLNCLDKYNECFKSEVLSKLAT